MAARVALIDGFITLELIEFIFFDHLGNFLHKFGQKHLKRLFVYLLLIFLDCYMYKHTKFEHVLTANDTALHGS